MKAEDLPKFYYYCRTGDREFDHMPKVDSTGLPLNNSKFNYNRRLYRHRRPNSKDSKWLIEWIKTEPIRQYLTPSPPRGESGSHRPSQRIQQ